MDIELDNSVEFKPFYSETDGGIPHRIECVFTWWTTGRHRSFFNYCVNKVWWFFFFFLFSPKAALSNLWTPHICPFFLLSCKLSNWGGQESKSSSLFLGRNLFKLCISSLQILWVEGPKDFNRIMMTNSPRGHRTKSQNEWGSCFRNYCQ